MRAYNDTRELNLPYVIGSVPPPPMIVRRLNSYATHTHTKLFANPRDGIQRKSQLRKKFLLTKDYFLQRK